MEEFRKTIEDLKEAKREQQRKREERRKREEKRKATINAYLNTSIERLNKVRDEGVQAVDKNRELIRQLCETAEQLQNSIADDRNDDNNVIQMLNTNAEYNTMLKTSWNRAPNLPASRSSNREKRSSKNNQRQRQRQRQR